MSLCDETRIPVKYVSAQRLHRAISNLKRWGDAVGQQSNHAALFLAAKHKGVHAGGETEYRDSDDKAYWNQFMRLTGSSKPYFDPVIQEYRPTNFPHNSAFKARNDRWTSDKYGIASRSGNNWRFASDYVERLATMTLTDSDVLIPYPEPDFIAWLYRYRQFDDMASLISIRDDFRAEFNLTPAETTALFSESAFDDKPEDEEVFLHGRRVSEELVSEIAKTGNDLDLPELIALSVEKSGPQPVRVDDVVRLALEGRGQLILQGPPGTGKTYLARQVAAKILGASDDEIASPECLDNFLEHSQVLDRRELPSDARGAWEIVQFHPSYNYEDFVRGISSQVDDGQAFFRVEDRTVASLSKLAKDCDRPIVLIVDEINRGDISKVLGELIFGLEYRELEIRTPYSVDGSATIAIPNNLYLIATMNTSDRSIALIDYAVRRRFDFIEVAPSRDALEEFLEDTDLAPQTIERTLALFDGVNGLLSGQPDHLIGHTYFMAPNREEIAQRFVFQTLPLLAEYRREGILGEHARVKPAEWPREAGIPLVHPRPFDLAEQVANWL